MERAGARLSAFKPLTVAEKFEAFAEMNFRPHGLFVPYDTADATDLRARMRTIGKIPERGERLRAYYDLQDETEQLQMHGVEGQWNGQQAWARSTKRFRQVAVSRRGGKSLYASCEAIAYLLKRPRCRVWIASGTMHLVTRCFDMVRLGLKDLDLKLSATRSSRDEQFIVVERGGGSVEGVSLDERAVEAGAGVDFVIVDEGYTVTRDAWLHTIMPPLTDRAGHALIISSYKGQENFFYDLSQSAAKDEAWDFFSDTSWEVNFYAFPEGRQTQSIQDVERMSADDMASFLEEYGNIPSGTRRAVLPQYRDAVHAGFYPYVPGIPVILGIDPSGGSGQEYGLVAVQRHGYDLHVIDEFYQTYALTEDVLVELERKVWRTDVQEGVCDSSAQGDIRRWREHGYNILSIDKPMLDERIPIYRKMLRDPFKFWPIFLRLTAEVLEGWGDDRTWDDLSLKQQKLVAMEIEAKLSPSQLHADLIRQLQECSRIHINEATCPNVMQEHKTYVYRKPSKGQNTVPDKPRKWKDHLIDALGYLTFHYCRFDVLRNEHLLSYNYVQVAGRPDIDESEPEPVAPDVKMAQEAADEIGAELVEISPGATWLQAMRQMNHGTDPGTKAGGVNYVQTVRR